MVHCWREIRYFWGCLILSRYTLLIILSTLGLSLILVLLTYSLNVYVSFQKKTIKKGGQKTVFIVFHTFCFLLWIALYAFCILFVVPGIIYLFLNWVESRASIAAVLELRKDYVKKYELVPRKIDKVYASESHRILCEGLGENKD